MPKAKESHRDRVLVVRAPEFNFSWGRYAHFNAFISHAAPAGSEREFEAEMYADDAAHIRLTAQASEGHADFYGHDIYWDRCARMGMEECERALRTLRPLRAKMDRMYREQGSVATMGQWLARIALALNCKRIIIDDIDDAERADRRGKKWVQYPRRDFSIAISVIDRMAAAAIRKCQGDKAEEDRAA